MDDPFGEKRGVYKYGSLQPRLKKIKEQVEARKASKMEVSEETAPVVETPCIIYFLLFMYPLALVIPPQPSTPAPQPTVTVAPMDLEKKFDISALVLFAIYVAGVTCF